MKKYLLISLIIILLPFFEISCMSDVGSEIVDTPSQIRNKIVGKWALSDKNFRTSTNENGYVHFFEGGDYVLAGSLGVVSTGNYEIKEDGNVRLGAYAVISNLKVDKEKVGFTITVDGKTTDVSGAKIHVLTQTEISSLLSRKWKMLPAENGKDSLALVSKTYVTYNLSGTYDIETYTFDRDNSSPPLSLRRNWKFHDTLPDRFVYKQSNSTIYGDHDFTIIRELTPDMLKITESHYYGISNYTFVPAE